MVNIARAIEELKAAGVWTVGLAGEATETYDEVDFTQPTAIVLGSEGEGLRRLTRERCDRIVKIPMAGSVDSLSVSVAAGVALFEAVREDLYPDPPPPPFPETERLKPLATKAAMREAAKRYDNCLATRVSNAVSGFSAFYEWRGGDGAVVEIGRDAIFGWRLEEAKGPRNAVLDTATRAELVADLTAIGVYVGRSGWQLERALSPDTGRTWRLPFVEDDLADVFGD